MTITNGNTGDDAPLSGEVSGLSLHPSSGEDVDLTCTDLSQIQKGASGTVTCSAASALTTAGTFTLVASNSATVKLLIILEVLLLLLMQLLKLLLLILIILKIQGMEIKKTLEVLINYLLFY